MNEADNDLLRLLDEAVAHLANRRLTFTDVEALSSIWDCHYDFAFQEDPLARFALVSEADGKRRRQWRLQTQTLANNRLLDALTSGTWDGRDLETALARLDAEDHVHYIFCPYDPRFTTLPDGTLEPAAQEHNVVLPSAIQVGLDALGPALLQQWYDEGAQPLTVRQISEKLGSLGWAKADERNGWLFVRAWLPGWSKVIRAGQDYWIPVDAVPQGPTRRRLQVLPIASVPTTSETSDSKDDVTKEALTEVTTTPTDRLNAPAIDKSQVIQGSTVIAHPLRWTHPLRTIHLLEGFLPVPATARSAYPPRVDGKAEKQVLRGLWFDSDEQMWLWLDRDQDRLYGPDLAHQLEWLEAGDLLRVEWRPDVIILRRAGHDDDIQREELRLVDPEELKVLRGGVGENSANPSRLSSLPFPRG